MAEERSILDPAVLEAILDLEYRRGLATAAAGAAALVDSPDVIGNSNIHWIIINGCNRSINRATVQYLCEYLSRNSQVTEVRLQSCVFTSPTDSGLELLRTFFTTNKTLLDVTLVECDFGSQQATADLLSAFRSSRNVTDVKIHMNGDYGGRMPTLLGAPLGACYSEILQRNTRLRRFDCGSYYLGNNGMRAMRPGLESNNTITKLILSSCRLDDEGIRLLADSLASRNNSTLEMLNISSNDFGPVGLSRVTQIIEKTKLTEIDVGNNRDVFEDENITCGFTTALSRTESLKTLRAIMMPINASIFTALEGDTIALEHLYLGHFRSLPGHDQQRQTGIDQLMHSIRLMKNIKQLRLSFAHLKLCIQHDSFLSALDCNLVIEDLTGLDAVVTYDDEALYNKIVAAKCILTRNWAMNRTMALLGPQPTTNKSFGIKSGLWPIAIGGLGAIQVKYPYGHVVDDTQPGLSSIFRLFQLRPFIFDKLTGAIGPSKAKDVKLKPQIERSGTTTMQPDSNGPPDDDDRKPAAVQEGCKRRRL